MFVWCVCAQRCVAIVCREDACAYSTFYPFGGSRQCGQAWSPSPCHVACGMYCAGAMEWRTIRRCLRCDAQRNFCATIYYRCRGYCKMACGMYRRSGVAHGLYAFEPTTQWCMLCSASCATISSYLQVGVPERFRSWASQPSVRGSARRTARRAAVPLKRTLQPPSAVP